MRAGLITLSVIALGLSELVGAQPALSATDVAAPTAPAASTHCDCVVIPALKLIDIEIMQELSSATAKTGDRFPIRLAAPIFVDGRIVVAAGAAGYGEVVHAQKKGMGGGGGELLLAARYLEVDGQRLRLRSFKAGRFGKNQVTAALVTSYALGPFGLAVTGKDAAFAVGSVAEAKIAEPFTLRLAALPAQADRQAAASAIPIPAPAEPVSQYAPLKEIQP